MDKIFVSEAARRLSSLTLTCLPKDISKLLYDRKIPDELCPIIGGRRCIPVTLLPTIEKLLRYRAEKRIRLRQQQVEAVA